MSHIEETIKNESALESLIQNITLSPDESELNKSVQSNLEIISPDIKEFIPSEKVPEKIETSTEEYPAQIYYVKNKQESISKEPISKIENKFNQVFISLPKEIEKRPDPINYTTLVVSGGSVKGHIALGVLQYALDRHYLDYVKTYIGTSIGSAISYLLAIGYTPRDILVYLCVNHVGEEFKYYNMVKVINGEGSFSFDIISKHLEKMTLEKIGHYLTFREVFTILGKKLIFTTYNETQGYGEYLSVDTYPDMPVLVAVQMSSLLPFVFEKFRYMGSSYIDGGIFDNFPLLQAQKGEKILGINMLPRQHGLSPEKEKDLFGYIHHLMFTPVMELVKIQTKNKPENCDIIEIIDKDEIPLKLNLDNKEKLNYFSKGYQHAKKFFCAL